MKIFNVKQWKITDPIPTEETIDSNFLSDYKNDLEGYTYINYNLTEAINKLGLEETQLVINQIVEHIAPINKEDAKKIIWTCQHISVSNLNFWDGIVFTPHATIKDDYYSIPHFPVNIVDPLPISDKNVIASFRGSFDTHITRKSIHSLLGNKKGFSVIDTGQWHFDNKDKEKNSKDYLNDLKDSKIILCPRGTGPSTIRLWESIASGCVPLVVSNNYKFPSIPEVDWEKICIILKEEHLTLIDLVINNFTEERLQRMQDEGQRVFRQWLSPNKMHSILYYNLSEKNETN